MTAVLSALSLTQGCSASQMSFYSCPPKCAHIQPCSGIVPHHRVMASICLAIRVHLRNILSVAALLAPEHKTGDPSQPQPSPYLLPRLCRPSKENAQALSKVLADSDPASLQEWDLEKGLPGPLTQSPDPLLRLGRLPSISESGSRKLLPQNAVKA